MTHKIEIVPNNAIYIDGERVIGSKPYGLFLTTTMIVSDDDLERLADRCLAVIADRKTENSSEIPNNSTISKMEQVDEPTEITYQNCSDALLKMWMDNVLTDAEYNRIMDKLNNAQRKDEPTISKMEQVDKDINVRSKDEPQTERSE